MTTVERVGEGLARQLNRRQTLKRAAVAVFGAVAAWTVEGFRGNSALAQHCGIVTEGTCTCTPPEGLYCSGLDPSFCAGSPAPAAATTTRRIATPAPAGAAPPVSTMAAQSGYYQCCDCDCYGQLCACREFISTGGSEEPVPPPSDDGRPPLPPGGPPQPPPGFGDDPPELPPGVPPCFPFCD